LMKKPELAGKIVEAMVKAVKKPVTVKFRKGFDETSVNAPEFAHILEESGAAAVAVHGRTREQYYSGKADWDIIAKVKSNVKIPVIGNGDIFNPQDASHMLEYTGCDAVMVARGAQGNPWIFNNIKHFFKTGEILGKPGFDEVFAMILRHLRMLKELKGEWTAVREMRKHVAWYTEGFPYSAGLRRDVNLCQSCNSMLDTLRKYGERLNGDK